MIRLILITGLFMANFSFLFAQYSYTSYTSTSSSKINEMDYIVVEQIISFMINKPLTLQEKELLRKDLLQQYKRKPIVLITELRSLSSTLNYLREHPEPAIQHEIRSNLIETLKNYRQKGNNHAVVTIVMHHLKYDLD